MNIVQYEASWPETNGSANGEMVNTNGTANGETTFSDYGPREIKHRTSKTLMDELPVRTPVDINFQNVSYEASLGWRKGKKRILHDVHGRFPAGKLIAIMGPSGAGKSTLLDVLSGYRITGVEGFISVDGRERDLKQFRRMSCYIQQDDRLQPLLTVYENMTVAANLKLPVETKQEQKTIIINTILETIGLKPAARTKAGRLSGGQKKRLSIALELINNPLVMFLDEPTTGLDSSTCKQVVLLLRSLAQQGRTIICTIHQPSALLFQLFDQVYILARGHCAYQGTTQNLIPFLENAGMPCPRYHNPADYAIELACGEYGDDLLERMVVETDNGRKWEWFENQTELKTPKFPFVRKGYSQQNISNFGMQETSFANQLAVLMWQGYLKVIRDSTLTYLRLMVNIFTGFMLGLLFTQFGNDASKILNNYYLLFAILIHHMMSTQMLTILTFPTELNIIIKEHFNRWYSLKAYYISMTIVDLPVSIFGCFLFSIIVYFISGQPLDITRFSMFFVISLLVVFAAQGVGLMIGAVFDVTNGTFLGPTISVPLMMFSGFAVAIRDLPAYTRWGTYMSYLRFGIEGYTGAIYGLDRAPFKCPEDMIFCPYNKPKAFLELIDMKGDQFWTDVWALVIYVFAFRIIAFLLLKWKLTAIR